MKCDRIREDLGAYLDDELDSARRSELDGHLASCEACTAQLERLRKLSRLVADVPRAAAPAGLAARIASAAHEPRPRLLRLSRWTGAVAAVAAVLLVGVVTIVTLRERDARDTVGRVAEMSEEESPGPSAAGEDAGAALDREKLEEPAVIERSRIARKGWAPEKRRDSVLKKGIASGPAESAAAPGSPVARAHGKGAAPAAEKAVAARTPAAPRPARRSRKGKADAAPPAPRKPVVGKRGGFRATRAKAGPGGRAVAQQAAPARPGEQVRAGAQAAGAEAEESDRSRGRLVEVLRQKEGLDGKKENDKAAEARLAKAAKAKAPAREDDRAGGEAVIRLQLQADSPAKELARIIAAAERLGGGVSRRAEQKAVRRQAIRPPARDRAAADETAARRPGVVRVRIPRERAGDFLASLERLTLPETDEAPADARARTRTRPGGPPAPAAEGRRGAAVSRARRPGPSQAKPSAVQGAEPARTGPPRPARWVVIEIVIHTPLDRPVEAEAARERR
jgi:hypothetical protein